MGNSGRFVGTLLAGFVLSVAFFLLRHAAASPVSPELATADQVTHDGLVKTAVVSDGSSLYVAEEKHGHMVISKIVPATGEESTLSAPFPDVRIFDVSPDHTRLLASPTRAGVRGHELWTIPLTRVASARLADLLADDAAWSPNGEQISFVEGSEIFIASSEGKNLRKLAMVKGRPFSLRFSPDGNRIRYSVSDIDTNTSSLWEMASDGSNPHQLLPDWNKARAVCCGVWSGDGGSYIFQATQSSPTTVTTLWALPEAGNGNPSTTEPVQLTEGPMSFGNPWPAADGRKIWALGVWPMGEVVQYDPTHQRFSQVLSGISATDLDYSPDGRWVTYVSIPDGTLWRSRADGSDRLQLTRPPERIVLPRWAPDSKTIAYVSMKMGAPSQIMLVSLDGGKPLPMRAENRGQIDANWSADGQKILYGDVYGSAELGIHLLDLNRHEVSTIPGSQGLFSPRWSPDGRYIVAMSPDFTTLKLFDFHTQQWITWLTEPAGAVSYPIWSADSKSLYFDDQVTDEESIRRVKVGEDHPERVFGLHGIERYPGVFGQWTGRTPDGAWMFVRDRSTQEVYSLNIGPTK
jgi:Tol biopolymer transport system component